MTKSLFFVLLPLAVYIPMALHETFISFRRIGKYLDKGGHYLHVTWEATHTFLVLSFNYFIWLYSSAVVEVGREVFWPLLIFGAAFIVRAILYTELFYIKSRKHPSVLVDTAFAWSHVVMLVSITIVAIRTGIMLLYHEYEPNETLTVLLLPGVFLMIPLVGFPLYYLYKTKN